MNVEVFLTGSNVKEEDVKERTVVMIDVLRSSSTIAAALNNGARDVVPVPDMAQASKIASNLDQRSYLLGGERDGKKIEGYHFGNSPLEYTRDKVDDRTIILNTTNGTAAIERARQAEHLIIAGFVNAERVVHFVREVNLDVVIVCAGWRNRVSLEDTLCAGLILYRLWDGNEPDKVTDTAHIAFAQYNNDKDDREAAIRRCNHAQWLRQDGQGDDVDFCMQIDSVPVLPYYDDSRIILLDEEALKRIEAKASA